MHKLSLVVFLMLSFAACKSVKKPASTTHSFQYIKTFHEGVRLKLNGELDEALGKFNTCLLEDEKDDAVHFAMAQLYLMKDDVNNAAIHTQRAADIDPKNKYYQSELAFMYEEIGKNAEAAACFEKLSKSEVQNIEYYLGAAENYMKLGKLDKALEVLNTMEKYVGSSPEIALQKFRLYASAKKDKEALQVLMDARSKYPDEPNIIANLVDFYMQRKRYNEGITMLRELVLKDPNNGLATMMLGEIEMQNANVKEGLKLLKSSIRLDGPIIDQKMRVLMALQEENPTDADLKSLMDYMVTQYPKNSKVYSLKGDYYLKNNLNNEAIEAYKGAVKYDPNLFQVWNKILLLEYESELWDSLAVDSERCFELFPVQPMPYFTAGVAYNQKGKYDLAIEKLEASLDIIVNDATLEAEVNGQLGESYFAKNNFEKGKSYYQKAIEKQPKSLFLKNNYAYRLCLHNIDLTTAKELVAELEKSAPEDARFLDTRAYYLFREGKYIEALHLLGISEKQLSTDKIVLEHMGDCFYFLKQIDNAVDYWKKAEKSGSMNTILPKKIQNKTYYEPKF